MTEIVVCKACCVHFMGYFLVNIKALKTLINFFMDIHYANNLQWVFLVINHKSPVCKDASNPPVMPRRCSAIPTS